MPGLPCGGRNSRACATLLPDCNSCVESAKDFAHYKDARLRDRVAHLVRSGVVNMVWLKPRRGWVKANADGAYNVVNNKVSVGGVIRDEHENWLFGFSRNIGICSSLLAEVLSLNPQPN
ncbi:hypothetical protein V6N12_062939 [Hibiscus sabdariffa]|uniref:RNase H type-1 domain-containing protein n=1 Tax=Hibiscus sabdariffa TaxID=183260 RepID=A0ABR2FAD6_9ROSI